VIPDCHRCHGGTSKAIDLTGFLSGVHVGDGRRARDFELEVSMSDMSQGPGWWQASDNKWYPPVANTPYGAGSAGPAPYQTYHPAFQTPYPGYPVARRATNGLAIASLVLGILWIYWLGSILALVFGYIALSQIKERNESGRGMAIAGTVLGWIGVATLLLTIAGAVAHHN
jgi:Domain of unknown function (DUF4190)